MRQPELRVLWIVSLICCLNSLPARAQPFPATPLLMGIRNPKLQTYEGDVWAWDGQGLIQRTVNGYSYAPIVSPTGAAFVYLQDALAYVNALDIPLLPQDISLWDLRTAQTMTIAAQPDKAADGQAHYALRSRPAWSPDGKLLAWTEIATDTATSVNAGLADESLVVYDVTAKASHTLLERLTPHRFAGKFPLLSEVSIGPGTIFAVKVQVSEAVEGNNQDRLYFYNASGKALSEVDSLEKADPNFQSSELIWLSGLDRPYLSCIVCSTKIDPHTGQVDDLLGTPELYSPLAPHALSIYYGADSGNESNTTWIIALDGKQVSKFDSVRIATSADVAISPDGRQIASANYAGQGTTAGVFIYQAWLKATLKITTNVIGLGWGPMAWRVHPVQASP